MTGRPDPHQRFNDWLLGGAQGEPPRDLALHASVCGECTARVGAFDLLTATDPGRAPLLPSVRGQHAASSLWSVVRYAGAFGGVTLAAAAIGLVGSGLIDLRGLAGTAGTAGASETPGQAVLAGTGRPSPTPDAQPSASETSSVDASSSQAPSAIPSAIPSAPPVVQPPPPPGATPRPPTPRPTSSSAPSGTAAPSATPSASGTPSGSPSATPTPEASVTPTPEVTPSPVPDDCVDGIDNDGDTFIDALDPGCLLDGNEPSA